MRLVFVTQAVDADDPNLGATVDKLRALSARCDELVVLCDRVGSHDLPAAVSFRTFGGTTRAARGLRFLAALGAVLRGGRPAGIVAHMCPIYLVLAAPFAKPLRIPLLLWYTHWQSGRTLRAATALASAILSVDRGSFPLDSAKVHPIGHGIDLSRFAPSGSRRPGNGDVRLLALGRLAPWKGLATLLDGVEIAVRRGVPARLEIRGPAVNDVERAHREELGARIRSSSALAGRVTLEEPLTRDRIPALLGDVDALVSAANPASRATLDKVVYEASGCAVPVIACNPLLGDYLAGLPVDLRFRGGDAEDLARVLADFAKVAPPVRAEAGRELRRRAERGHSVESWADGVVEAVRELRR